MNYQIASIKQWIQGKGFALDAKISGAFELKILYRPNLGERLFELQVLMANSHRTGAVYHLPNQLNQIELKEFCSFNYIGQEGLNPILELAFLDSFIPLELYKPLSSMELTGNLKRKSEMRAHIVARETLEMLKPSSQKRILQIGVVQSIAQELIDLGAEIHFCDLDLSLRDEDFFQGRTFVSPRHVIGQISEYDAIIATGMTVSTASFLPLVRESKSEGVPLLIYAETGAHLAEWMLYEGVRTVVSEPFPYYIFHGTSIVNIFRN